MKFTLTQNTLIFPYKACERLPGRRMAAECDDETPTIIASSASVKTVDRGSRGLVLRSSNVARFRH